MAWHMQSRVTAAISLQSNRALVRAPVTLRHSGDPCLALLLRVASAQRNLELSGGAPLNFQIPSVCCG